MNSSLKKILIFVGVVAYLNAGWAYGYYATHPELVTSDFVRVALSPFGGMIKSPHSYNGYDQCLFLLLGPIVWILKWVCFVIWLCVLGGIARLLIL